MFVFNKFDRNWKMSHIYIWTVYKQYLYYCCTGYINSGDKWKKYFKHDTWTDILQAKGMGIIYIRIFEILWTCSHKCFAQGVAPQRKEICSSAKYQNVLGSYFFFPGQPLLISAIKNDRKFARPSSPLLT